MTTVEILRPVEYYKRLVSLRSIGWLFELTDSHYPKFLALGFYFRKEDTIFICKIGRWSLRLLHEQGHTIGLKHLAIWKIGTVMHPWGFLRGHKGEEEIVEGLKRSG